MAGYSEEELDLIKTMWLQGHHSNDISAALKDQHKTDRKPGAISTLASRMGLPPRHQQRRKVKVGEEDKLTGEALYDVETDNPNAKMRPCIRCREDFHSSHAGNRICTPCKNSNEYDEVSYIDSTGIDIDAIPGEFGRYL